MAAQILIGNKVMGVTLWMVKNWPHIKQGLFSEAENIATSLCEYFNMLFHKYFCG